MLMCINFVSGSLFVSLCMEQNNGVLKKYSYSSAIRIPRFEYSSRVPLNAAVLECFRSPRTPSVIVCVRN